MEGIGHFLPFSLKPASAIPLKPLQSHRTNSPFKRATPAESRFPAGVFISTEGTGFEPATPVRGISFPMRLLAIRLPSNFSNGGHFIPKLAFYKAPRLSFLGDFTSAFSLRAHFDCVDFTSTSLQLHFVFSPASFRQPDFRLRFLQITHGLVKLRGLFHVATQFLQPATVEVGV